MNHLKLYEEFSEDDLEDFDSTMKDLGELGFDVPGSVEIIISVSNNDNFGPVCAEIEDADLAMELVENSVGYNLDDSDASILLDRLKKGYLEDRDTLELISLTGEITLETKDPKIVKEASEFIKENYRENNSQTFSYHKIKHFYDLIKKSGGVFIGSEHQPVFMIDYSVGEMEDGEEIPEITESGTGGIGDKYKSMFDFREINSGSVSVFIGGRDVIHEIKIRVEYFADIDDLEFEASWDDF